MYRRYIALTGEKDLDVTWGYTSNGSPPKITTSVIGMIVEGIRSPHMYLHG